MRQDVEVVNRPVLELVVRHQDISSSPLRKLREPLQRLDLSRLVSSCSWKTEAAEEADGVLRPIMVYNGEEE